MSQQDTEAGEGSRACNTQIGITAHIQPVTPITKRRILPFRTNTKGYIHDKYPP